VPDDVLVFAYGSNLCLQRIGARVGRVEPVGVGFVRGHVLRFHKHGRDGSAKADAYFTGAPGDLVWGAIYRLGRVDKQRLDRFEGLGRDYLEFRVEVDSPNGMPVGALIYRASPEVIDPARKPFSWYIRLCATGARQHALPASWVAMIEAADAVEDPQAERHELELAVLEQS
jgi:hypothetical protein